MSPISTPAVRLSEVGVLEHTEVSVLEPGPGEVLIRVSAVGLCGSDAHWYEEGGIGDATLGAGLIPGHEFSGVIESGPRHGERVAVDPAIPCLACELCLAGRPNLCLNLKFAGHGPTDGALRGHLVWPERCLVTLPEALSDEEGALLEPLGIALHAIDLGRPSPEGTVVVVGAGPVGLLLVAALREHGVGRIIVTELLDHRLREAPALGATEVIAATGDGQEMDALLESVRGGAEIVFETGGTDTALHTAMHVARPGGRVVLIGIPTRDRTSFVASVARRKELSLLLCRRMLPQDLVRATALAGGGLTGLDRLISHRYPMTEAVEAFHVLVQRRGIKILVVP